MLLLLTYLVAAIGFSFYCSIAEAVLLSITPSFIATLRESNSKAAARLQRLKSNVDRPLAAILSLNTIAHTAGAAGVGAQAAVVFGESRYAGNAVGIASAVMTLLVLVFSEIIPKTIGALHWRRLGPAVAVTIDWLILALYPLVWLSEILTRLLSGGHPTHALTREELSAMAGIGARQGILADHESRVFRSLMRMPNLVASDVMTPRLVVFALQQSKTVGEVLQENEELNVSRIPVFDQTLDELTGFVLRNELLLASARGETDRLLSEFSRPLETVLDSTPLPKLLEMLLEGRFHIAMASDQYGSIVGLVTLEDLIETLLGFEIVDESDTEVDLQSYAREQWAARTAGLDLGVEKTDSETSQASQSDDQSGDTETSEEDAPNASKDS